MYRFSAPQSAYQTTAGGVYVEYLRLMGREVGLAEVLRAHDLDSRPLSACELDEFHRCSALLVQYQNNRSFGERPHAMESQIFPRIPAPPAFRPCLSPAHNERYHTHGKLFGEHLEHSQRSPILSSPNDANEDQGQQQSVGMSREQGGSGEFESADQETKFARLMQEKTESPKQQSNTRAYGQGLVPQSTNDFQRARYISERIKLLKQHERQEYAQKEYEQREIEKRGVEQQTVEQQKSEQQKMELPKMEQPKTEQPKMELPKVELPKMELPKMEQQRIVKQTIEQKTVQLPAKSGSLHPGPSRLSFRNVLPGDSRRSVIPQTAAYQETYYKYREEVERRKAIASVSKSEHTRTTSVKNTPERKAAEATDSEAVKMEPLENKAPESQSQAQQKGSKDCDGPWLGERKHDDISKQSGHTQCPPKRGSASKQPSNAAGHDSKGVEMSERRIGNLLRDVSSDSSPSNGHRAATEAIRQSLDDLANPPKRRTGHQGLFAALRPSTGARSRGWAESLFKLGTDGQTSQGAAKALGDLDLPSEWEVVDGVLRDDGWTHVEREFEERECCWAESEFGSEFGSEIGSGTRTGL